MIVAVMSSLPSDGVDVITPTISPISDSVSRALVMSSRMSPAGLTPLEQPAQRLGELALELLGVGSQPVARQEHEGASYLDERAHGPSDALLRRHFVDPGRRQSCIDIAHRGPRQRFEQALPVGEVAVHRRPGDAGRFGDVVHAGLLALDREDLRGSVEDRRGHALLQRLPEGWLGHRRLAVSLENRLTRRSCLI